MRYPPQHVPLRRSTCDKSTSHPLPHPTHKQHLDSANLKHRSAPNSQTVPRPSHTCTPASPPRSRHQLPTARYLQSQTRRCAHGTGPQSPPRHPGPHQGSRPHSPLHTHHSTTTAQPQYNHSTTTTQPQHNHSTTTAQPQHKHSTNTTQPQHNHSTTTAQPRTWEVMGKGGVASLPSHSPGATRLRVKRA
jgi:hypothetical protein